MILICVFLEIYAHFIRPIDIVYTHFFYIPLVLSGLWFFRKGVWTAVFLGLLHMSVSAIAQGTIEFDTLIRSAMFVLVAMMIGSLAEKNDQSDRILRNEKEIASEYLNIAEIMLVVLDKNGNVTSMNQKGCDIIGLSQSEIVGKNWFDHFIPDRAVETVKRVFDQVIRRDIQLTPHFVNAVKTARGEERLISWKNACLYDAGRKIIGVLSSGEDITEINEANSKLRESERRFRDLFEHAPFAYQSLDETGHFLEANPKWLELFGFEKEEVIGSWFGDYLVPEMKEPFRKRFEYFKKNGTVHSEFDMITKSGRIIQVGFEGQIGYDANHAVKQTHCMVTDITEINIAKKKLEASENKFRTVVQSLDAGVIVHAPDSSIIDSNDRASEILGLSKEQLFGKIAIDPAWMFVDEDEKPLPVEEYPINLILANKQPIADKLMGVIQSADRNLVWVKINGTPLFDRFGEISEVVVSFIEVTELIQSHKEMAQSEERFRLLTTQMQLGLALHEIICDDHGNPVDYRFLSVNHRFEQLTGLRQEEIVGKTVLEVLPQTEKHWIETYGEVALSGKPIQFEDFAAAIRKYYSVSAYSPKIGQFAVTIDDITERRLLENERAQRQQDLLTSQKIAHLGTWRLIIDTNEVTWSEELYKMYGFDPTQPVPPYTEHMKLFTKASWDRLTSALSLTRSAGIPYELELEMIIPDGSDGWMWVKGEAERDDQGRIVSISGAAQDISQRKRLERELNETNKKIIAVLEKSPVAIEFYDAKGCHTYSNEAAITLFGVTDPDDLDGTMLFENPNISRELVDRIVRSESIQTEIEYDFQKVKEHRRYKTYKSGKILLNLSITPLVTDGVLSGYIVHTEDISEERRKQNEIEYLSYHDYLTKLYNRRFFVDSYHRFISHETYPLGVMMIDINGLKIINDAFGHKQGDVAIKMIANMLLKAFDEEDVVARIGGDEFAILAPQKNPEEMQARKIKIVELTKNLSVGNIELSLAIGFESVTDASQDIDEILNAAEKHLYRHKITVGTSIRNHAIKAILTTLTDKYKEEKIHSMRVSSLCKETGTQLGLSKEEVDLLELAGMYHDIGKISIPDAILDKPGKLTEEEFDVIKTHTLVGYQILKAADEYSGLAEFALSHHERWDGFGYPKGLKGTEIPLFSRIITLCDSFEAMTSDRTYRKKVSIEEAIVEIKRCSGSQFDPDLATVFVNQVLSANPRLTKA